MCEEYAPALAEKGCELTIDPAVYDRLAKAAMGGKSAARDLRSVIRREIEDKLANLLIERGTLPPRRITLSVREDTICVDAD